MPFPKNKKQENAKKAKIKRIRSSFKVKSFALDEDFIAMTKNFHFQVDILKFRDEIVHFFKVLMDN